MKKIKSMQAYLSILVVLIICCLSIETGFAFNFSAAATYADNHANSWQYDTINYPKFSSDCTNFVSQILYNGGYPMTDDWYCKKGSLWGFNYTKSWSSVNDLKSWLSGKGYLTALATWDYNPTTNNPQPVDDSANLTEIGEVLFYDFDGNGYLDHSTFVVAKATDPDSKLAGDLVDSHTSDRWHAIWHLKPYNSFWQTTVIYGYKLK